MPSARELLEQADALMQKNRARVESEIPILMDAVAPPVLVPSAEVDVTDVPVLTDVAYDVVVDNPSPPPQVAQIAPWPPVVSFEGDPSDWLVMDTIDPSMHSITGGAPDTLGVVPPFSPKAAGSARTPPPARSSPPSRGAPSLDPLGFPPEWSAPPIEQNDAYAEAGTMDDVTASSRDDVASAMSHDEVDVDPPLSGNVFASASMAHIVEEDVAQARSIDVFSTQHDSEPFIPGTDADAVSASTLESVDDAAVAFSAPHGDAANVEEFEPPRDLQHDVVAKAEAEPPVDAAPIAPVHVISEEDVQRAEAEARQAEADARQAEADAQLALQRAAELEEERWHSLAEQISMQVLQRVDLFTDTGLKDQLADRLKPIVARASAELVGTITDHVGQLLRTYVAEAIEREIAAWRSGQR